MGEKKIWFSGLQSLRAMLFFIVYLSHSIGFHTQYSIYGGAAVSTFFIISGFLSGFFYDENTKKSLILQCTGGVWAKIKKFYPFYFVFVIVGFFLHRGTWYQLVENVFLIQSYFGTVSAHSFNPPTWFLSSIMLSYLLAPVINKICYKFKNAKFLLMFLCVATQVVLAICFTGNAGPTDFGDYILYTFPPVRMIEFIEGVLLSILFHNKKEGFLCNTNSATVMEAVSILSYLFLLAIADIIPRNYKLAVIWVIPSIALVWLFAETKGRITNWCSNNKMLQYLGKRSYELYIAHRLILWFFAFYSRQFMGTLLPFIITLVVVELWFSLVNLYKSRKSKKIRI